VANPQIQFEPARMLTKLNTEALSAQR